ncbi:hypothetical protein HUF15_40500 [Streptomyces samsunensis]|uniref:hypothetical protein n=1 Tax=Streptomyces malaysiensis TaxID=92644 RepID=UPI001581B8AA|nr:hypothetical protein [Streptomyces samsunensis]NUH42902.1 hypothetical protein [Streptomyces samsunensis]
MTTLDLDQQPFSLNRAPGFTSSYGVPVVAVGEYEEVLIMLGWPDERTILAATSAQYRAVYGHRILPGPELDNLTRGIRRTWGRAVPGGDYCPWHIEETAANASHAQPVTIVNAEWLKTEDVAIQEECPTCGRASRATQSRCSPGRIGWSPVRRCRYCTTQWPSADVYRVSVFKMRPARRPNDDYGILRCFACGHSEGAIATGQPIAQPLCETCRGQHTPDTWQTLITAGYATEHSNAQRDRWLYTMALRGTPPAEAAAAWTQRCALVRSRALAASQKAESTEARP